MNFKKCKKIWINKNISNSLRNKIFINFYTTSSNNYNDCYINPLHEHLISIFNEYEFSFEDSKTYSSLIDKKTIRCLCDRYCDIYFIVD